MQLLQLAALWFRLSANILTNLLLCGHMEKNLPQSHTENAERSQVNKTPEIRFAKHSVLSVFSVVNPQSSSICGEPLFTSPSRL